MFRDGHAVQVSPADQAYFENLGFLTRSSDDLVPLVAEVRNYATTLADTAEKFVNEVLSAKEINPAVDSGLHAMSTAMSLLHAKAREIVTIAHDVYPTSQGNPDEHGFDPSDHSVDTESRRDAAIAVKTIEDVTAKESTTPPAEPAPPAA
jgi:hypothetical protein